jgi:hypothetical protein
MKSGIGHPSIREEDVVLLACPISTETINDKFNKSHRDAAGRSLGGSGGINRIGAVKAYEFRIIVVRW